MSSKWLLPLFALLIFSGSVHAAVLTNAVCPFCSAVNRTFAEQMDSNDVVVIAKLTELAEPIDDPNVELPKSKFEITQIVKGEKYVTSGMKFRSLLVGGYESGEEFLVMGVDPPNIVWSTPMKTSKRVSQYLMDIQALPRKGADRLAFFQAFFEDKESVLAYDAYDEFANAPYEDLIDLKDRMDKAQLLEWIRDPETIPNRRRLYFTMLGVCGNEKDTPLLEEFIRSGDRKKQAGLDALIGCYLTLKGEVGVSLIEETFIKDKSVDYVDTLAAVSALRFHGTETDILPRKRIVEAIRHLLDRPKMADMIIPDLARWEDWSCMERLVQMFKDADEETNWLRVPVITYLRACPKPEAKNYIAELEKIDPDAVKRANFFLDWDDDDDWDDEEEGEDKDSEEANQGETKTDDDHPQGTNDKSDKLTSQSDSCDDPELFPVSIPSSARQVDAAESDTNPHTVKKVPVVDVGSESPNPKTVPSVPKMEPPVNARRTDLQIPTSVASTSSSLPVASRISTSHRTWQIILIPMAISFGIFVLMWTVLNGWFERLIY